VVVAVVAVRVVEAALDDVIDMVAVGNRLVPAAGTMEVMIGVREVVYGSTSIGVLRRDLQCMFLNGSIFILMMEVTGVDKIDVVSMLYLGVATACAVDVIVGFVGVRRVIHSTCMLLRLPLAGQRKHAN